MGEGEEGGGLGRSNRILFESFKLDAITATPGNRGKVSILKAARINERSDGDVFDRSAC